MHILNEITQVHLELSSYCNAKCPGCPRNFYGLKYNSGYEENNLTLDNIKTIFKDGFIQQLKVIRINGNFGDFVMNPDSLSIVKWFNESNPDLKIKITTNGSAQREQFWNDLGKLNVIIEFTIDGFSGTHEKYRQNTNFNTVVSNAETFIKAGGIADCKFIEFDFNVNEKDKLKEHLSDIGFRRFNAIKNQRGYLPVFDDNGNKLLDIDYENQKHLQFNNTATLSELIELKRSNEQNILFEDIVQGQECKPIKCDSKQSKEIYISSMGDVFPCCFMGFAPDTFKTAYYGIANTQIKNKIKNNNAIQNDLSECIKWFKSVEDTWNKDSFNDGQLIICQNNCQSK